MALVSEGVVGRFRASLKMSTLPKAFMHNFEPKSTEDLEDRWV